MLNNTNCPRGIQPIQPTSTISLYVLPPRLLFEILSEYATFFMLDNTLEHLAEGEGRELHAMIQEGTKKILSSSIPHTRYRETLYQLQS